MEDDKKFTEDEIFRFRNYRNRFEALSDSDHDSTGEDSSSEEQAFNFRLTTGLELSLMQLSIQGHEN
ncbi:hypothetical protein TNCV_1716131 [Trichonephila clavipes]|nr:hypothetical protein TNCV_1716131 [Trichonephila clavipes]